MLLSLFTGPFGKYAIYATVIVTILTSAFGYVKLKEHEATKAALANFNQQQLEQTIKDNNAYQLKINELEKTASDLTAKNNELNNVVDQQRNKTLDYINKNKSTSKLDPLYNNVLNQLKGGK